MEKETHRYFSIISHDHLEDIEFWDGNLNRDFKSPEGVQSPESAEVLLTIANLSCRSSLSVLQNILNSNEHISDVEEYVEYVYSSLLDSFGVTSTDLLMLDWLNDEECTTITDAKKMFIDCAENIFSVAPKFCDAIASNANESQEGFRIANMINALSMVMPPDILYRPIPAILKSTGEIVYCDCFAADSAFDALYLCFVLTVREKKIVRRCNVCGDYFIPMAKSNEVYCKNCRKTTYDTKIKQNEVLKTYRTVYKTQNARKQRNSHRPYIVEKFEKWKDFARLKLQQCQSQEITLEEMKKAISSDSWLYDAR